MKFGLVNPAYSCKNCVKRYPACQDSCEQHLKEKAEFEARKAKVKKNLDYDDLVTALRMRGKAMASRSWHPEN